MREYLHINISTMEQIVASSVAESVDFLCPGRTNFLVCTVFLIDCDSPDTFTWLLLERICNAIEEQYPNADVKALGSSVCCRDEIGAADDFPCVPVWPEPLCM